MSFRESRRKLRGGWFSGDGEVEAFSSKHFLLSMFARSFARSFACCLLMKGVIVALVRGLFSSSSFLSLSLVLTARRTVNPSARRFDRTRVCLFPPADLSLWHSVLATVRGPGHHQRCVLLLPSHDAGGNEKAGFWHRWVLCLFWPWAHLTGLGLVGDGKEVFISSPGPLLASSQRDRQDLTPLRLLVGRGLVSPTAVFPSDWNEPVVPARFPVRFGFGSRRNRNRNSGRDVSTESGFDLFFFVVLSREWGATIGLGKTTQDQREPPRRF
ncbi:hypothetical protein B0J18DRAFT_116658 [Chaetomium sp. MPI-SDFR-AT-0129]|nr:hypothetical protein B0J18DRAFT_116658 [Chaetomium sp. MPI-SDFR-AT-0129]